MVEDEKKKEKRESAVLEATLATAQAELSLSWSWAKVDQYILGPKHFLFQKCLDQKT